MVFTISRVTRFGAFAWQQDGANHQVCLLNSGFNVETIRRVSELVRQIAGLILVRRGMDTSRIVTCAPSPNAIFAALVSGNATANNRDLTSNTRNTGREDSFAAIDFSQIVRRSELPFDQQFPLIGERGEAAPH